jgi:hypothetical protein
MPEAAVDALTKPYDFAVQNGAQAVAQAGDALAPGLQRNIKPKLQQLDLRQWAAGLADVGRRVCRIEIDGGPAGTGFLVGPQVVLTNWHVVETPAGQGKLTTITCRFDYAKKPDGSFDQGIALSLAAEGLVHHRSCSPAELSATPDQPPPTPEQLDYALLRLASAAGEERGWIGLPDKAAAPAIGTAMIIAQHPLGGPMKLAIDTEAILPLPAPPERPRLRYTTNTEPGSSGSPCLSMDWQLLALHHFGDPAWQLPKFNQGVPAALIRADLVAAGHGALLGAVAGL